jgi:hypothetical protein
MVTETLPILSTRHLAALVLGSFRRGELRARKSAVVVGLFLSLNISAL